MIIPEKGICIYGASSASVADIYKEAAYEVGRRVAEAGLPLISGGGRAGLMCSAIDGALTVPDAITVGVLPLFMVEKRWQHPGLTRMISTDDMHARKRTMASLSRGVIALPGGCGTLDELMEIITWRQLGLYIGQVVLLNTDGYYDPLLSMFDRMVAQGFMRGEHRGLWHVASTPEEAVELATAAVDPDIEFTKDYPV